MSLETLWFILVTILWGGYLLLEGFDFGVGMLLPFLPRDEDERTEMLETIGPVWDGNEVWLVVAAGATFAAFPAWYATMFSGFYLALLLLLVLLIVRVVSFEWRSRSDGGRWRHAWLWLSAAGSVGVPFLWGVALSALLHGVPINSSGDFSGSVGDILSAYTVFAGIAFVLLCACHGAAFLALKTQGELRERSRAAARRLCLPAAIVGGLFVVWTVYVATDVNDRDVLPAAIPAALCIASLVAVVALALWRRSGWTFAASAAAIGFAIATLFTSLYPRVLVSDPDFGNSLTVQNAASAHYPLVVITVTALVLLPVVLLYQGWTYHILRRRLSPTTQPREITPLK
jgi:cytochrome bd ubiquinol oxidase subunit II